MTLGRREIRWQRLEGEDSAALSECVAHIITALNVQLLSPKVSPLPSSHKHFSSLPHPFVNPFD